MKNSQRLLVVLITSLLACGSALADKPSWAGGGKEDKHGREDRDDRRGGDRDDDRGHGKYEKRSAFNGDHRNLIRDYYGQEFSRGNCPPGLAKKHNGCLPPGQAKKWAMGRPLPRGIEMYDLPPNLLIQLGGTPEGYKYVRVASDVLMIAVGTNLVVDAITDLGRQ